MGKSNIIGDLTQAQLDMWIAKIDAMSENDYNALCNSIDKKIEKNKMLTKDEYIFNVVSAPGIKELSRINFFLNGAKVPNIPEGEEKTV